MDKHHNHNDSSQMKELLQPERQKHSSKETTSQASCSSSSSAVSSIEDSKGAQAEGHEPAVTRKEEGALSCCQLSDLKRLPQCHMGLGPLKSSKEHIVLIDVGRFNFGDGLFPHEGRDVWHSDFVKMPSSQVGSRSGLTPRWDVIAKKLKSLANKKSVSPKDVSEAIIKYNSKYKDQWSFDALHTFDKLVPKTENYFHQLFPEIAALALKLPELVKKAIPLLRQGRTASITLSQPQIACLLANAFFCTFPHRNTSRRDAEYARYPSINFSSLFGHFSERKREKLRAIMHYFKVVTDTKPKGLVTFERRCLSDTPYWKQCKAMLPKLHVTSHGQIELEGKGMLQVDFASSWIGGGVLDSGLVQEEILFLMNPELIVARLFTEKLEYNECLIITGSQQFSLYSGYGDTFEWTGPYQDDTESDEWARRKRQILAIDALNFKHRIEQYNMRNIVRELNKAYCGFKQNHGHEEPDIATGKWGCGAFNGDPELKAVIQLMAAAKAGRGLAFFTFGDEYLKQNLQQIYHLMVEERITVEKLFKLLEDFCEQYKSSSSCVHLFEFIKKSIGPTRSQL